MECHKGFVPAAHLVGEGGGMGPLPGREAAFPEWTWPRFLGGQVLRISWGKMFGPQKTVDQKKFTTLHWGVEFFGWIWRCFCWSLLFFAVLTGKAWFTNRPKMAPEGNESSSKH